MPPMTFSSMAPLTAAEFLALPENTDIRLELQEGAFVVKPRPTLRHQKCMAELFVQLDKQSPGLAPVFGVDVDLQLVPPDQPGTVRVPDIVVLSEAGFERVRDEAEPIRASDLVLVGEIREPGSHRTDTVLKRAEYAAAGIDHYWIVDPHDGPSLTAYRLGGGPEYEDAGSTRDLYDTDDPFPVRIDLAQLVP